MVISTDRYKKNSKFSQLFMIKTLGKQEAERNFVNPITVTNSQHHWDSLNLGTSQECLLASFFSTRHSLKK